MGLQGSAERARREGGVEDALPLTVGEDSGDRVTGRAEERADPVGAEVAVGEGDERAVAVADRPEGEDEVRQEVTGSGVGSRATALARRTASPASAARPSTSAARPAKCA